MVRTARKFIASIAGTCLLAALCRVEGQEPRATQVLDGFALGADVSELPILESHGAVYRSNGRAEDPIEILKQHGFNWMRVRLFVNPSMLGPESNDLLSDVRLGRSIKAQHLSLLLDMFYSDTWADPAKQATPAAWRNLSHAQLVERLRAYNRDILRAFRKHHAFPNMVEVGNEITNGMLWPDGKVSLRSQDDAQWQRLGDLLRAAIEGVREGSGRHKPPLIMIHLDRGGDAQLSLFIYRRILRERVQFDVIGLSDYPWWQGSLEELKTNLNALAETFHKPIVVVETSFPYLAQAFDSNGKALTPEESVRQVLHFPSTPSGQAEYARALVRTIRSTPDDLGTGVFYWAADWIPVKNWGAPRWSADWEGRALFDSRGNALPAMTAFGEAAGRIP